MSVFVSNVRRDQHDDFGLSDEPALVCPTLNFSRVGDVGQTMPEFAMDAYREREAFNARSETPADPTLNSGSGEILVCPTLNFSIKKGKLVAGAGEENLGAPKQFLQFTPPPASSSVPQHREKPHRRALGPSDLHMQDDDEDEDRDHAGNLVIAGDEDVATDPVVPFTSEFWPASIFQRAKSGNRPVGPKR